MLNVSASDHDRLAEGHRHALPDSTRATPQELARDVEIAAASPVVRALLKAADSTLLVLNSRRQIVAASNAGAAVKPDIVGLRPGEAFGCVNAQAPRGCGSAPACETCGALGAIMASQRSGRPTEAECLLRSVAGELLSFEFNVRATPFETGGAEFTALTLRDISSEKRRQVLEQLFFHDVLNTVCGLRGWSAVLLSANTDHHRRAAERIDMLSRRVEREIRDHRDLVLAENGSLTPSPATVPVVDLLREVETLFASHRAASERTLELIAERPGLELHTDPSLLLRVLTNMVRNAFEATPPGGVVRVRASGRQAATGAPRVRFSVHNAGVMPPDVQLRVFQRSFTTKGERGRGLGTYSMKLLGERYLGGEVAFESTADRGTTFWIDLPADGAAAA